MTVSQCLYLSLYGWHYFISLVATKINRNSLFITDLDSRGLIIALEKVQQILLWKYLGFQIFQKQLLIYNFISTFENHYHCILYSNSWSFKFDMTLFRHPNICNASFFQFLLRNKDPTSHRCFSPQHYALLQQSALLMLNISLTGVFLCGAAELFNVFWLVDI